MSTRFSAATMVVVASMLGLPLPGSGQVGLPLGGDGPSLQLEIARPFFADDGFGFLTSVLDATVVIPTGRATLFGRLGLSQVMMASRAGSTLSNPRIGAVVGSRGGTHAEVHVDLSLGKEFAGEIPTLVAIVTDLERGERFATGRWSLGASVTNERVSDGNVLGIRLGANYVSDDRMFGLYSGFGSIAAGIARVGAELSGLVILADYSYLSHLSERDRDFGERTTFFLTLKAELPAAFARPEFYARAPLDDDSNQIVDFVLGAKVRLGG